MKKLLCISAALIALDQAAKHLARHFFAGSHVEIVQGFLGIYPFHNTYLGWLGWWVGPVYEPSPLILFVLLHLFFAALLVTGYKYLCFISPKNRALLNAFFVLAVAGAGGALIDNMLFGGSWDFIYVVGGWIIDLKDIYLLASLVLLHIFCALLVPQYLKLTVEQRKQLRFTAWIRNMRKDMRKTSR